MMNPRAIVTGLLMAAAPFVLQPLQAEKATGPVPGEQKIFSDWAVACDNIKSCSAQGLMQEEESWESWVSISIDRPGGPDGAARLTASFGDDWPATFPAREMVRFTADDGTAISMTRNQDDPQAWSAPLTAAVADQIRNASWFNLRDADGRVHARGSLVGLSAALRYMDDQQGRAGTVTALIARGDAPASAVAAAPAAPVIRAAPQSTLAPFQPTEAQWAMLSTRSGCDTEMEAEYFKKEATRLDAKTTLLAIPCSRGAYNIGTAYYIARGSGKAVRFAPAPLDQDAGWSEKTGDAPVLVNGGFRSEDQSLSHHNKGRGIGDCGDAASWVWDGKMFRLTNIMVMNECRGSNNWLRVWTAESGVPAPQKAPLHR